MNNIPTIEEYQYMLNTHDWNYHYSDDHSVWLKGAENEQKLLDIAKSDSELMHLWQQEWTKRIKNYKYE